MTMKKSLILFTFLLAGSLGFLVFFQTSLLKEKDNVTFQDEILFGDAKDAEGITVDIRTEYSRQLFWDTTYKAGQTPAVSTDFTFYNTDQRTSHATYEGVSMDVVLDTYNFAPEKARSELEGIDQAFHDLYHDNSPVLSQESSANDNTKVKVIKLKDYYDYYPFYMGISLNGYEKSWNWNELAFEEMYKDFDKTSVDYEEYEFLKEYFRIPIIEDDTRTIQLDMYYDNYSMMVSHSNEPEYYFASYSTVTEDALYFLFTFFSNEKDVNWDSSLLPDGYGIYRIPYETTAIEGSIYPKQTVDVKALDMAYPLDKNIEVFHFTTTEDKSKLILTYQDSNTPDACTQIAIIDAKTMETLQIINLEGIEKPDGSTEIMIPYTIHIYDDFIAIYCSSDYLAVLDLEPSGLYSLDCIIDIHKNPVFDYYVDTRGITVMDRKDDKIAVTGLKTNNFDGHYYSESCGFYLAIFDRDGLVYYSEHDSSLDRGQYPYQNQTVEPLSYYNNEKPLAILWE